MYFSRISMQKKTKTGNRNLGGIFSSQEAFGLIPALITIKFGHSHLISNGPFKAELVVPEILSAGMFH